MAHLLAIDQGTTSTRAIIYNLASRHYHIAQQEFPQHFPRDGWVEHNPEDIWQSTRNTIQEVLQKASLRPSDLQAIGITNQRETTLVWDRRTGEPIYPAIVWQDRRTSDFCQELIQQGCEQLVKEKTGLVIDPYFSASKIRWLLDNVPEARARAERGELAFGTIDSYLLWRLSGGRMHKTDATNAARTALFNIHQQQWDAELLALFDIPASLLPEVCDSAADFGYSTTESLGAEIPILSMIGDQQSALVGQGCFEAGMAKSTYGTGCFVVLNTGSRCLESQHQLLSTLAYRIKGEVHYALEGSIFVAGAAVQWLRDKLGLIRTAAESEERARRASRDHRIFFVPAFTGLGAPYWDPAARGAIYGLTRDSSADDMVAATLQSVCYQTRDLLLAMELDGLPAHVLRVDGGMAANDWMLEFLADILGLRVDRPASIESTALGAIYLAGLQAGFFSSLEDIAQHWQCERSFQPQMEESERRRLYSAWLDAVKRTRSQH